MSTAASLRVVLADADVTRLGHRRASSTDGLHEALAGLAAELKVLRGWRRAGGFPARTAVARWQLFLMRPVDLVVQRGCAYSLGTTARIVTYDDGTFAQLTAAATSPELEAMNGHQRRIYERATACCTVDEGAARSIVEDYGVHPAKVHVVGTGTSDLSWTTVAERLIRAAGIPDLDYGSLADFT